MRSESFDIICHVMSLIYVNGLKVHLPQLYKGISIIVTATFNLQHKRIIYSLQGQDSAADSLDAEYELLEVSEKNPQRSNKIKSNEIPRISNHTR